MRVIETSVEEDLSLFSRYLWQVRVRHRIFEERGRQVLEVAESQAAEVVRSAYDDWHAGTLILERRNSDAGSSTLKVGLSLKRVREAALRFPVLSGVLVLAVVIFPFSLPIADGELTVVARWLTLTDLTTDAGLLESIELWRWFTPVFLHFSVLHLVFNVAVVTDLGRRVESIRGSKQLAFSIVVIGVLSNLGQYAVAGNPVFGGLSGVAYGLLGYVLVSQRRFPDQPGWHVHPGFAFSLLIFLVLFSTGVTELFGLHVANAAHWVGLVAGGSLALLGPKQHG
ncbi:MAG: rhomboid family intramembrane serine protease [Pseudomonadales bacterium]